LTERIKTGAAAAYKHAWKLVEKKKLIRRMILLWFLGLVCYATIRVFGNMDKVNASVATIYGTLLALNGVIFGFYSNSRKGERPEG